MTTPLVALEGAFLALDPATRVYGPLVIACTVLGSLLTLYVATQAIEEVRNPSHMLVLLSGVVVEFILFSAFQYWYVLLIQPSSFSSLSAAPVSLLLQSTMVFVFNPLYLPVTELARMLLLINTLGALGLVLFILQNIWQLRSKELG
jgi:hypothetical protein